MTIAEARGKCKSVLERVPRDVLIIAVLVLTALASFGLGYLAGLDAEKGSGAVLIPQSLPSDTEASVSSGSKQIVASKTGTKYYLSSCAGASRITPANKIFFASVAAAQAAGYTPASTCKGL